MTWPERRNRIVNLVMFSLTGLCAIFIISVMVIILGYLVINGGRYLSFDFFTKLPTPVGETGGGMANAIRWDREAFAARFCNRAADRFSSWGLFG